MKSPHGSSPALLTIGVTAHRDLSSDSVDAFRSDVHRVLSTLTAKAPTTSIVFISGLAEGGDQEAADVALSFSAVRVVGALPMEIQEYRKDFEGSALRRFDDLVSRCDDVVEVVTAFPLQGKGRDVHYQHFGRWLARNSHILIAGWDGSPPEFVGGTADTIYFKAEGLSPLPSADATLDPTPPDPGVVFWSQVARGDGTLAEVEGGVTGGQSGLRCFSAAGQWSEWNGDLGPEIAAIETFNAEMTPDTERSSQSEELFERADHVASSLQGRYRRALKSIMASSVVALGAVDVLQATGNAFLAVILISMLALSVSLWLWIRRSRLRERCQQARALAEGARIQVVWLASGLTHGPADMYLASQGSQFEWIRASLRAAWLIDCKEASRTPEFDGALRWLDEQVTYFEGSANKPGAIQRAWLKHRSLRRLASGVFALAVSALVVDMIGIVLALPVQEWLAQALRLTWSLGVGIGIAIVSYSELMGFSQLSQRYALTVPYLRQGRDDLRKALEIGSDSAAQAVIRTAGTESLREAGDWLILHSQRQVRPV